MNVADHGDDVIRRMLRILADQPLLDFGDQTQLADLGHTGSLRGLPISVKSALRVAVATDDYLYAG